MSSDPPDHFAHKASSYERNQDRVSNVEQIAQALRRALQLRPDMQLMDFGAGTGLLLERIAPYVAKITALDVSPSMQAQLRQKLGSLACEVELIELDLERASLDRQFDGIVSSMTLHHIQDVPALLRKFHSMLAEGGFIALADLDREDGRFHSEDTGACQDTGVHHHGFEREAMVRSAVEAGFQDVRVVTASVLRKHARDYPVFLLTARRA